MSTVKNNRNQLWFVNDEDYKTTLSQLYHENSKVTSLEAKFPPSAATVRSLEEMQKITAGKYKRYDYTLKYPLPAVSSETGSVGIRDVLSTRRSVRKLAPAPLDLAELGALLTLAAGLTRESRFPDGQPLPLRAYPSAGALYPIEVYPLLFNVPELPRGMYHYDPYQSELDLLAEIDRPDTMKKVFLDEPMVDCAGAIIILSAVVPRLRFKYGERGYRYVHLEAGHLAQNLILVAQALGLSAIPVGGFVERTLEELIDADGVEEIVLHSVFVGKTESTKEP